LRLSEFSRRQQGLKNNLAMGATRGLIETKVKKNAQVLIKLKEIIMQILKRKM